MGALLQLIGEPSDDQIATEAQRRSGAMQCPPGKPQLLGRAIDQPGNFTINLGQVLVAKPVLSGAVCTETGKRLAIVLASRSIVDWRFHRSCAGAATTYSTPRSCAGDVHAGLRRRPHRRLGGTLERDDRGPLNPPVSRAPAPYRTRRARRRADSRARPTSPSSAKVSVQKSGSRVKLFTLALLPSSHPDPIV